MAEIAFNTIITKNLSAGLAIPKYIAKINALKNSPKLAKFVGGISEATTQAIAFEFAEGGSLAMGAGEYYGGKWGEKMVSAITKGKGGKFLALFGKVLGTGIAGTGEEYMGEFIDEGFKQGFFTKEQFETTFGRSYDEALDKFLITAVMATALGGGSEVGSALTNAKEYYTKLGDVERLTEIEQLIAANKESVEVLKKAEAGDPKAVASLKETKNTLKTEQEVKKTEDNKLASEEEIATLLRSFKRVRSLRRVSGVFPSGEQSSRS